MYSDEQYRKALEVYEETKSVTKTITILGYPARRQTLYNWIHRKRILPEERSTFRGYNTEDHPRHPSLEQKLQILHRCFELGEDVQSVSNEVGYSTASIYAWRRKYIQKGAAALMNPPNERRRGKLIEGNAASSQEIDELKTKIQDMQIELDRGCHYRWPGWIKRVDDAGLTRSMSRKGCSPDNSACEGFFGRMKNEMFYGRSWQGVTLENFMQQIEAYMIWYRDERIKLSLGGLSPAEFRRKMEIAI